MSKMIEGRIECPFYLKEGDGFIVCEGVLNGTKCVHRFQDNKQKRHHEVSVCSCSGGRNCRHYRTVSILYERGLKT